MTVPEDARYGRMRTVAYRRTPLCLAAWMGRTNWRRISSTLDAWAPFLMLVLIGLLLGPTVVSNAFTAPSGWNWFMLGLWVFVAVGQIWQCMKALRRRGRRGRKSGRPLAPENVPVADVEAAIASTTDRISAIKALREQHRGLGLKAAADLVDGQGPRDT
ncbi:ribosomal protein L7/L12 [Prescottella equi]|uniref:ribosomal protein L7/L12 n=1 Tax=Rhodococcus hoagii TaxID=43767 RepID=UPI00111BEA2E|nr:ribosomal protein L7/L12 [Prescottella equi]NKR39689.1 hypothetical protein [Prescottella equi]NKR68396.1 hypothetical protein [Prescottella equi]NKR72511.1 hypothetical protein [Prescottella equi]NKR91036.1 hypothetical protein [Prescottella equi]NKS15991.1 hypothetical protein [Prescottella equi]